MVRRVQETEECLGQVSHELSDRMRSNRKFARSLFVCTDIKKGELFTEQNVRSVRHGDGCSPKYLPELLGRPSDREYKRGEPIVYNESREASLNLVQS